MSKSYVKNKNELLSIRTRAAGNISRNDIKKNINFSKWPLFFEIFAIHINTVLQILESICEAFSPL